MPASALGLEVHGDGREAEPRSPSVPERRCQRRQARGAETVQSSTARGRKCRILPAAAPGGSDAGLRPVGRPPASALGLEVHGDGREAERAQHALEHRARVLTRAGNKA
jgi:hypothetical protein